MGEARGESERVQGRVLAKACQLQDNQACKEGEIDLKLGGR